LPYRVSTGDFGVSSVERLPLRRNFYRRKY